jgi:hypothetical protein
MGKKREIYVVCSVVSLGVVRAWCSRFPGLILILAPLTLFVPLVDHVSFGCCLWLRLEHHVNIPNYEVYLYNFRFSAVRACYPNLLSCCQEKEGHY